MTMACDLWRDKIGAFVDSELSSEEATGLNTHLRSCSSCSAGVVEQFQLKRMTNAAGSRYKSEASPELRRRVLAGLAATKPKFVLWRSMPALATAAALLFAVILYAALRPRSEEPFRELADIHTATLASSNPVDVVSSDLHTVKPWFQGKIPFSFNPPEMKDGPYSLVGGRVVYFRQTPGAEVLCQYKQHRISVFIFEDRPEWRLNNKTSVLQPTGLSLESWSQGGLRYAVMGDAAPEIIHNLAALWREAARS